MLHLTGSLSVIICQCKMCHVYHIMQLVCLYINWNFCPFVALLDIWFSIMTTTNELCLKDVSCSVNIIRRLFVLCSFTRGLLGSLCT